MKTIIQQFIDNLEADCKKGHATNPIYPRVLTLIDYTRALEKELSNAHAGLRDGGKDSDSILGPMDEYTLGDGDQDGPWESYNTPKSITDCGT